MVELEHALKICNKIIRDLEIAEGLIRNQKFVQKPSLQEKGGIIETLRKIQRKSQKISAVSHRIGEIIVNKRIELENSK